MLRHDQHTFKNTLQSISSFDCFNAVPLTMPNLLDALRQTSKVDLDSLDSDGTDCPDMDYSYDIE